MNVNPEVYEVAQFLVKTIEFLLARGVHFRNRAGDALTELDEVLYWLVEDARERDEVA